MNCVPVKDFFQKVSENWCVVPSDTHDEITHAHEIATSVSDAMPMPPDRSPASPGSPCKSTSAKDTCRPKSGTQWQLFGPFLCHFATLEFSSQHGSAGEQELSTFHGRKLLLLRGLQ